MKNQTPQERISLTVFITDSAKVWNLRKLYQMSLCSYLVFLGSDLCFLSPEVSQHKPKTTGHGFHLNYLRDTVRFLLGSTMVYAYVK